MASNHRHDRDRDPPDVDTGCDHPSWAKERTDAGAVVCRLCEPRDLGENERMYY